MSLLLDDETKMLRESVKHLLEDADALRALRRWRDANDLVALTEGQWESMKELGLPGILIPEGSGGSGLTWVASIQVSEMMGRTLAAGPFISSAVMAATALLHGSNTTVVEPNLELIAQGKVIAIAAEERLRHQPLTIATRARRMGNGYSIDGRKVAVIDGNVAVKFIVAARDEMNQLLMFLIDASAAGLSLTTHTGLDSKAMVEIGLDNVQASDSDLICTPQGSAMLLERVYDAGRLHLAAEMLGAAQEAFDRTLDYLKTRVQFGRKIGEFQALQHRAALLFGQLEVARSIVLLAAVTRTPENVSLAKARVGDIARLAATEAVQMHGGIGMTDDFDMHFFLKRVRVAAEQLGDSFFHAERYAKLHGL